ncbi:MAG TPA: nuclease-related domain-containing protein, partial [Actinomycetota bacterium]|nr:nuclease-related domain-containing protein [Actinomycetota bacterium]
VIGPTGMFVLETKDWQRRFYPSAGRLFHNGRDAHDAVTQAQRAAMEVKQRPAAAGLPRVWVEAWVVSTRATIQGAKGGVLTLDRVTVRQLPGLADAVRAGNGRLTPVEVARARAAVLRWDRGPVTVRSLSG